MLLPTGSKFHVNLTNYLSLLTFVSNIVFQIVSMHHNSLIHFSSDENVGLNTVCPAPRALVLLSTSAILAAA